MKALRYSTVAWESIMANKMRSLLTMLGLIIGVASVLTTVGIGRGAAQGVTKEIEGQGINTLVITPKTENITDSSTLTSGDARSLADPQVHPEILAVAATNSTFMRVANGNQAIESQVTGTTAAYASIKNLKVDRGRFFTPEEETSQQRVVVLSSLAAHDLFKSGDPLGQNIRINNEPFTVVGILKKSSGDDSEAYFRPIYTPLDVAQNRLINSPRYRGDFVVSEITVQVVDRDLISYAETQVEQTLRLRHDLAASEKNDFHILNQARLLEIAGNVANMMTALLGSIGTVSLLVGGIGIMNIMLVSVTERTSEIGLRKALGAQDNDILLQFLIEALVLCALGSFIGIILSYSVSTLLNGIPDFPFDIILEYWSLLLALGVGLFSGFVFGLYPAIRATRLDPIEALRYE
ncbi:MAG TPA: ABC transporter permease [Caldilineaceae bacterium]|nr:ABC transporter permease [Caldilineaceae bacterium]